MAGRHSEPVRGLDAAGNDAAERIGNGKAVFEGRFGRMFPASRVAFAQSDLEDLAKAMVAPFDGPKDGPDAEESGIPALYTYLGQFIDHDLTFGPEGSFQKQRDPSAITDYRSPAFDLDNVYGRGPNDQPYMYAGDKKSFLLGNPLTHGTSGARDLQRNAAGRALIGDPRNDENAIVSQLQGLFLRFHNRVVSENSSLSFEEAQAEVRKHYQYVVVNDFLVRIVGKSVLDALRTNGKYDKGKLKYFTSFADPFMPVEFAVAAYRLGHSMVRPGYRLNDETLLPIFPVPGFPEGLTGFRATISTWGIDWGRVIDVDLREYGADPDKPLTEKQKRDNFLRLQFAYKLDSSLVDPLANLPVAVADKPPPSLALRNLMRGADYNLPTGQEAALAMGITPLDDNLILIGKGTHDKNELPKPIGEIAGGAFKGKCPLWAYILAEAMNHEQTPTPKIPVKNGPSPSTPQLGPVGGRIVAEVFLGLMFADELSYLSAHPDWMPARGKDYGLNDFVRFALGL